MGADAPPSLSPLTCQACVGLPRRTEATEVEPAALPPDVSPGGDFKVCGQGGVTKWGAAEAVPLAASHCRPTKPASHPTPHPQFLCLGVGVYNERPASADAAGDPAAAPAPALLADDGVELPQCVGVQIIRAQAVAQAPATLAADAGAGAGPPDPRARTRPLADPRTRTGPLPDPGALSLAQLAERFDKAAIKVVKRMGENADVLADAAKKAVGAAADAVFGGGRGK